MLLYSVRPNLVADKRFTHTVSVVLDAQGIARALRTPVCTLRVVKGPDRGIRKRVVASRLLIGSDSAADFALKDPTVSSVHCELLGDESGFRLRDLGSKNGVRIDGRRVQEAWLKPSDEVALGGTVVRFKILEEGEERALDQRTAFGRLRGSSVRMRELYQQLARASATDAPVLLQGETGTGKELAADAIFSTGARRDRPLIVVNCASLAPELAESELFGHEKGAFTGAVAAHMGAFERANGGTLFLDEVGELPLLLQPRLLGALERKTIQRVGGGAAVPVDVRVIASTSRELEREVNRGTFRADLFYRLAVIVIRLPALRERRADIPDLVAHFLEELPGKRSLSPAMMERLCQADYPGNVRELRNAVERAVIDLDVSLPAALPLPIDLETPFRIQKNRLVDTFEHSYLAKLIEACRGNVSEAARRAGVSRVHMHERLQRLGLSRQRS